MGLGRAGKLAAVIFLVALLVFASLQFQLEWSTLPCCLTLFQWISWIVFLKIFPENEKDNVQQQQSNLQRAVHLFISMPCIIFTCLAEPSSTLARMVSLNGILVPLWGALAILGVVWAIWARYTMGSEWRGTPEVRENHKLITYGPFKYTRHPIYTGIILMAVGNALYGGHWFAMLCAAVVIGMHKYKLMVEEDMLLKHFGPVYKNFQLKSTPN